MCVREEGKGRERERESERERERGRVGEGEGMREKKRERERLQTRGECMGEEDYHGTNYKIKRKIFQQRIASIRVLYS